MPEVFRTPEARFSEWKDYPFAQNFLDWEGLRMHYVDEGGADDSWEGRNVA